MQDAESLVAVAAPRRLDPIEELAIAMLQQGVHAAMDGDSEALNWLEQCGPRWIEIVLPTASDSEAVLAQLVEAATSGKRSPKARRATTRRARP